MNAIPSIVFYGLAGLLIITSLCVVVLPSIFYSAVSLVASLTVVAGLFLMMGADFLGAAQILVYIGGIMIIMLFVIMLSQRPRDQMERQTNGQWFIGACAALAVCFVLVRAFRIFIAQAPVASEMLPTSAPLGRLLLGDMLLPFEAVSLILLSALVGAVVFGQDKLP